MIRECVRCEEKTIKIFDLKECMGVDKVFDKALEEVGAWFYEGE